MQKSFIIAAFGALVFIGAAQAATLPTYNLKFTSVNNPATGQSLVGYGNYYISPYTGVLTTTTNGNAVNSTVTLYCDDFNHDVRVGDSFAVNEFSLSDTSGGIQSVTNARFYNQSLSGRPSGTVLYQEMAWLFGQMNGKQAGTIDAIQEAVWSLTSNSGPIDPSDPATNNAEYWRGKASLFYNNIGAGVTAGFNTVNYTQWAVLTDTSHSASAKQEFLINTAGYQVVPSSVHTPEPASFALIGGALLVVSTLKRRQLTAVAAKLRK